MTGATAVLLAEVRGSGGPWVASLGLKEKALTDWVAEQEDWVEELKERLERKRNKLVRLEEVEKEDLVPAKAHQNLGAAFRFNQGPDNLSQIEERHHSEEFQNREEERRWRI